MEKQALHAAETLPGWWGHWWAWTAPPGIPNTPCPLAQGIYLKLSLEQLSSLPGCGFCLVGPWFESSCPCLHEGARCPGLRAMAWAVAVESLPCQPAELPHEILGIAGKTKARLQDLSCFRMWGKLPQQLLWTTGTCKSLGAGNASSEPKSEAGISAQLLWCLLSAAARITDVLK